MKRKEFQSEPPLDTGKEDSQTLHRHRLLYSRNGSCIKMSSHLRLSGTSLVLARKRKRAHIPKSQNKSLVMTRNGFPGEWNCDNVERSWLSARTFRVSVFIGHVGEC